VDTIWKDRPTQLAYLVFHLDEKYSGMYSFFLFIYGFPFHSALVLITNHIKDDPLRIRLYKCEKNFEKKKAKAVVMMVFDEVAWSFNLLGSNVDFNLGELGRVYHYCRYKL
jgi:hypothetical protein